MTHETRELMVRVLKLPVEERAALAARVIESLVEDEPEVSAQLDRAWRDELGRRHDDLAHAGLWPVSGQSGESENRPWRDASSSA